MSQDNPMFQFEPILSRPCTGTFELADALVRRLFFVLGSEDLCIFGLRFFDDKEGGQVGLFDPRRLQLQKLCRQVGTGEVEIGRLKSMLSSGTGFAINSPRALSYDDPFGKIADLFLAGLNLEKGAYPEKMYTTLYLGTYATGFGFHNDPGEDTTLFVLDGTKHFALVEDGETVEYAIEKNRYLAWRAGQYHGSANAGGDWSLTINFAVGSPGVDGPAKYAFDSTGKIVAFL
jgi:hypothetical protein